jgi:hypothetical protein
MAVLRLRPDYEEKPEINTEAWPIFTKGGTLRYARHLADRDELGTEIDLAIRQVNFIGFLYEDGNIYPQPVMYSENGGLHFISQIESFASGKDIANRPTHVLFQRKEISK